MEDKVTVLEVQKALKFWVFESIDRVGGWGAAAAIIFVVRWIYSDPIVIIFSIISLL